MVILTLMFILGHIGLTIGLILLGLVLFNRKDLIYQLDFRIIAVFAILPDIIDKITGHVLFAGSLNNGRLFCHTLLFMIIFAMIFFFIVGQKWWVFTFPIITHQLFDQLWIDPQTWLWPYYGWQFESQQIDIWAHWLIALTSDPYIITTEILGIIVILAVFINFKLIRKKNLSLFIRKGKLPRN
jgi:inner membrane protein